MWGIEQACRAGETLEVLYMLIWLTVLAVLPWRYGVAHCVTKRGDQGRLERARPTEGRP